MVVAQLVEWSIPTPEIHGLNPDIGKILSTNCTIEKTKIKKKRPGMAHQLTAEKVPGFEPGLLRQTDVDLPLVPPPQLY